MLEWRFLHPLFLTLLPLPLAWLAWTLLTRRRNRPSVVYSDLTPIRAARPTIRARAVALLPVMRTLVLVLGIIALARPQFGQVERQRSALGVDIALVLDVSGSMQHDDFRPNRLEAAKEVVREFIDGRDSDRLSLTIFATTAAVLTPPTFDREAVKLFLGTVRDGILNNERTAIGMGLALAVDKLKESEAKSRVAILLTDGENNAGAISPQQGAEAAEALGVRVYTIGVGTNEGGGRTPFGRAPSLDEETLQMIADKTGGKYYRATSEDALRKIYEEIDRLERTEIELSEYDDYEERFMSLWAPALALLGLELLLRGFWLVRLP